MAAGVVCLPDVSAWQAIQAAPCTAAYIIDAFFYINPASRFSLRSVLPVMWTEHRPY